MKLTRINYDNGYLWVDKKSKIEIGDYFLTNDKKIERSNNKCFKECFPTKFDLKIVAQTNLDLPNIPNSKDFEIWADVIGFEGVYKISSLGNVKSVERIINKRDGVKLPIKESLVTPIKSKYKYKYYVNLNKTEGKSTRKLIHELVAEHFLLNDNNYKIIEHIDGDVFNNRFDNLRWSNRFVKESLDDEKWLHIKGYENRYEISNYGRVNLFVENSPILEPYKNKVNSRGYITINLVDENGCHKSFQYHRLLAEAFIPNPKNKKTVNHKDGNKANNTLSNLEWATHSENMKHAWDIGLQNKNKKKNLNLKHILITHY